MPASVVLLCKNDVDLWSDDILFCRNFAIIRDAPEIRMKAKYNLMQSLMPGKRWGAVGESDFKI